ncbi:MAG TPA: cytochrome c oxidase assembly protein [Mycobacteriales bacterium]|nr:cytochrome c oxidase assembly protein [Mycobacteriales bacterium]
MTGIAPLTSERFFGTWHFDPWVFGACLAALVAYLAGVRRVRRLGDPWPVLRVVAFVGLGLGVVVIATMSSLAVYSRVLLWPMALRVTLLLAIVPVGLGLGDPVGLVSAALSPAGAARWQGMLRTWPVRVLTFPAVAPLLAVATQFTVFYTGYVGVALRHDAVMRLLELQLVVTGCLFALPLLGVEILPVWCTQPVRMTFAAIDGLLDAIPGLALMTSSSLVAGGYYGTVTRSWGPTRAWDQTIGGGLMLTVAEVVAVPFVAILFVAWIREDATHAREVDAALDVAEARRRALTPVDQEPQAERPWWEVDPGPLADRALRYGWKREAGNGVRDGDQAGPDPRNRE